MRWRRSRPASTTPHLPSGFLANAEIYRRLADYKDAPEPPVNRKKSAPAFDKNQMPQLVTLVNHGPVAVITIDNPPVNALSPGVPEGLAVVSR